MPDSLTITRQDHVATVTLNRPSKHNALDLDMFAAIRDAAAALADDKSLRAVVLQGEGPSFCAGIDVGILQHAGLDTNIEMFEPVAGSDANLFQTAACAWRKLPVPVICAIHGNAFGAGLQVALGADLRFASSDARFSVLEIKWGIIPDLAITTTLTRLIAPDRAKELAWTGRIFGADEAAELGVITAVTENPHDTAQATAAAIAGRSPDAIRAIKVLFEESPQLTEADALRLEARLQVSLLGQPNQVEAVTANFEKRAPDFKD